MDKRDRFSEMSGVAAAEHVRRRLNLSESYSIGIILGTGWGDSLVMDEPVELPLGDIPGFGGLCDLEGHARKVVCGRVAGVPVAALRGRVHINERPRDPNMTRMVRLQTEMLIQLGCQQLILTCAAGGLPPLNDALPSDALRVGDVCVIDGFVTLFAPAMPLLGGEFVSPEDALDRGLRQAAYEAAAAVRLTAKPGGHVMLRGPFFEGRRYDKDFLALTGAKVVGMSVLPEACVAALYPDVKVLALAFVTNDAIEGHSHQTNLLRAKAAAIRLGDFLDKLVGLIAAAPAVP